MIQVSPAGLHELEAVWSLVKEAVAHMNTLGNPQWGPDYPTRDHFLQALEANDIVGSAASVDMPVRCPSNKLMGTDSR